MPRETGKQLCEYAQNRVGNALRSVTILYEDECEILYLRNNLRSEYNPEQYKAVSDTFRIDIEDAMERTNDAPVGDKHSIIHYHDDAYVFQFPYQDCHSFLLSVDPKVGTRLKSFIEGCENQI